MSAAIGFEAQQIVRQAAGAIKAGTTVKDHKRQSCINLGYPAGSWRIEAAWYGHASCWSAAAIRDLQDRFLRWREAEAKRAASRAEIENITRARKDRVELEAARNEHRAQLARIERQLAACDNALRVPHPDENRP